MKFLVVILTVLTTLSSAYWPSSEDPVPSEKDVDWGAYLELTGEPSSPKDPTLGSPDPSLGNADAFGSEPNQPKKWPRTGDHLVLIKYCYENDWAREFVGLAFEQALNTWREQLGDILFEHDHALLFEEAHDGVSPISCKKKNGDWDERLPLDTVAILDRTEKQKHSAASVGHAKNFGKWDHYLVAGAALDPVLLQHEWGHILGMKHEHQRPDRNYAVKVNCDKVIGHAEAFKKAKQTDPTVTSDQLCEDWKTAYAFGCYACLQFIPGKQNDTEVFRYGYYNADSIMQYTSDAGAAEDAGCSQYFPEKCPIAFYKDANDHSKGMQTLMKRNGISADDVKWVKDHYPFTVMEDTPSESSKTELKGEGGEQGAHSVQDLEFVSEGTVAEGQLM